LNDQSGPGENPNPDNRFQGAVPAQIHGVY
jgi:hypothetical protein